MQPCHHHGSIIKALALCALLANLVGVSGAADYTVYVLEPAVTDHMVLQDGPLPPVCKRGTTMQVFAARGEYEPASFVVAANKPLDQVRIEVAPVTGPSEPWPDDAVDVRVVKEVYRGMLGFSGPIPSLLVHDETFLEVGTREVKVNPGAPSTNEGGFLTEGTRTVGTNVLTGELRDTPYLQPVTIEHRKQFWITVKVPGYAYSGTYTTTLRIVPANADPSELTLNIHVYPFELLAPMIEYSIYYPVVLVPEGSEDWRSGKRSGGGPYLTPSQYITECRNMIAHGVTNPNIYGGVGIKPDGTLDYSNLEKILAVREKAGIGPGIPLYAMNGAAEPVLRPLTDEEKQQRIKIVQEVMVWAKQRGYPDFHWTGADEAWGEWLASERDSFKAINDGGGKVFVATGIQFIDIVGDVLRLPVLHSPQNGHLLAAAQKYPPDQVLQNTAKIAKAGRFEIMSEVELYRKAIDGAHRYGHKIFIYMNPVSGQPMPLLQRRSEGLGLWRIGFDGTMTWAYTHIGGEPVNQALGYAKIMRVEGGVLDTLHWEGFREGVDDVRYLTTLLDTLSRALGRFPNEPLIADTVDWLGDIDVSDGDMDAIRREMARRIVALTDLGYKEITTEAALATINLDKIEIVTFPEPWRFKLAEFSGSEMQSRRPPDDPGLSEKWFATNLDDSDWRDVRTDTAEQGWGTDPGFGWYRVRVPISARDAKSKKYKYLHFGACDEDAKVYINGKHVFDHTLLTTGLLAEQIWLMPFVVPLDDVKLRGNDLMAVRTINTEGMGGVWKLVHLILSEKQLSKRQVSALIEVKAAADDQ